MAAAMALPLMQTASIAFGFATNSRNVFKMIREVTESPQHQAHSDLVELSLLLMSIQQPFLVAAQLQIREEMIGKSPCGRLLVYLDVDSPFGLRHEWNIASSLANKFSM